MKISILIPVYKVENYIEACARSLFEQTYENIEYIFVNDCSPDNSMAILRTIVEDYPERKKQVRIIEHERNRGLSAARNTGVECAEGDYLMFVDSDDSLETDALQTLYDVVKESFPDIVVFDMIEVFHTRNIRHCEMISNDKFVYIEQLLCRKNVKLSVWGKLFRRDLFFSCGVRFIEGINFGEDYATTPRLVYYADRIVKVDKCLYNHTAVNSESYTNNINRNSINDLLKCSEVLRNFFENIPEAPHMAKVLSGSDIRNKVFLLENCAPADFKYVLNQYGGIPEDCDVCLPMKHRLVWILYKRKYYILLRMYVNGGKWIRKFLK